MSRVPNAVDYLLSQADTKTMRKREALWARLGMYAGEDLHELLLLSTGAMEPEERSDYFYRLNQLEYAMRRALEDLRSAENGMRGAEGRDASKDRVSGVYRYLLLCRASVRKLEQQVAELREELEPLAMRAGAHISAMWPEEER